MKHTEWYFHINQKYRSGLDRVNDKFDAQIEGKTHYAGSAGYAADIKEIEKKRVAEIAALRDECKDEFSRCIAAMEKNAQRRPMTAPTQDQLAILQALRMREKLTRDDLNHAANAMADCSVGLGVLEELAKKHEILGFHAPTGVSDAFVQRAIKSFADSANTVLKLERTNQRRQLMNPTPGTGEGPFGTAPSADAIAKFRVDVDAQSAQDSAARFGGVPLEVYSAFCEAVDG